MIVKIGLNVTFISYIVYCVSWLDILFAFLSQKFLIPFPKNFQEIALDSHLFFSIDSWTFDETTFRKKFSNFLDTSCFPLVYIVVILRILSSLISKYTEYGWEIFFETRENWSFFCLYGTFCFFILLFDKNSLNLLKESIQ